MEVDTINTSRQLIETDVIKSLKAGTIDRPYAVIRYQEVLFPTHEQVLLL
jgi:hypothetical protein